MRRSPVSPAREPGAGPAREKSTFTLGCACTVLAKPRGCEAGFTIYYAESRCTWRSRTLAAVSPPGRASSRGACGCPGWRRGYLAAAPGVLRRSGPGPASACPGGSRTLAPGLLRQRAMRGLGLVLVVLLLAAGCTTSQVTAFRDSAYTAARFDRLAVFALGMNFAATVAVERQLCQKLAPTPCVPGSSILPPTRRYSADEAARYLEGSGADAVLLAALVSDQSDTRYFGTVTSSTASGSSTTTGTVNLYGTYGVLNTSSYGTASVRTVSTPIYGYSRVAFGQLGLFERASGGLVWRGEIRIAGQGLLSITDDAFISSATSKVADELKAAGLVY